VTAADTARALEAYLAKLLVDPVARARFQADPAAAAREEGLGDEERDAILAVDLGDLELSARSFARKRAAKSRHAPPPRWWGRLRAVLWARGRGA
jgi:hypothetical protein